jgi:hypothetical protein
MNRRRSKRANFTLSRKESIFFIGFLVLAVLAAGLFRALVFDHVSNADFVTSGLSGGNPYVPTNLRADGYWDAAAGQQTDVLEWSTTQGAISYDLYRYGNLITSGLTGTSYELPPASFNGNETYTLTAVNDEGQESLPSNIAAARGATDPAQQSSAYDPGSAIVPGPVIATPQWNLGVPRVSLRWTGSGSDYSYAVYRDGVKVADELWGLAYIDTNVQAGHTYSYSVSGQNIGPKGELESPQDTPVSVTTLTAQPAMLAQKVTITGVQVNDDSATVSFDPVPGAVDYRIYKTDAPNNIKYMGEYYVKDTGLYCGTLAQCGLQPEPYSIEFNGLDVPGGDDLVVEAVDELGPFQTSDGMLGPGTHWSDGTHLSTNGQGDPSNVPNVIARSDEIQVTPVARTLTGSQAFFDTFRNDTPFVTDPSSSIDPAVVAANQGVGNMSQVENNNWIVRGYGTDADASTVFIMNQHLMDTVYDGPNADSYPFSHNNNAAMVFMPKATENIAGGTILHVTMEVDPHFDARRWTDIFITEAGQPLIDPRPTKLGPTDSLTPAANEIAWDINQGDMGLEEYGGKDSSGNTIVKELTDRANGVGADSGTRLGQDGLILANGSNVDLDKRQQFDLYISQTRVKIYEAGKLYKDVALPTPLPYSDIQVYYVHELYHTGNDRPEQLNYTGGEGDYWYDYRPYSDERHWDNMGQEVLSDWSETTPVTLPATPPDIVGSATPVPTPTPGPSVVIYSFDGKPGVDLADLVTAIRAYNGNPVQATITAWPPGGQPTLQQLVALIRAYVAGG